jgi:elongation factor Ts
MTAITPQMVKELRESTGAGMADCKKALEQAQGDMDKAVVVLRERGLASAQKKSARAAAEGVISAVVAPGCSHGFLVEVNCETDFVTRNTEFQQFVETLNSVVLNSKASSLEELLSAPYAGGASVQETVTSLVAKIGENILVRRLLSLGGSNTYINSYIHGNGRLGVLVELAGTNVQSQSANAELAEVAKNVAMQAAAMEPRYVNRDAVPAAVLESEKELFFNQYRNQGKPEAALPKIVSSRMETWFKEFCLSEQLFVKDDSKTVAQMVSEAGKKLGLNDLKVVNFVRVKLGEGVEKKSADFAAEVASQIAGANK